MTTAFKARAALATLACAAALAAPAAQAACYFVYGADQTLLYRSNRSPVDLSLPLHMTVPQLAPGATMIFSLDEYNCATEVNLLRKSSS